MNSFMTVNRMVSGPKTEIVQEVIRDYPGSYLVIGDRRQDLECARSCKSPFIGCLYGYGEKENWMEQIIL